MRRSLSGAPIPFKSHAAFISNKNFRTYSSVLSYIQGLTDSRREKSDITERNMTLWLKMIDSAWRNSVLLAHAAKKRPLVRAASTASGY